ncbi:MAG: dihydroorotate dehydrogenase [Thermoguttaceae bacterium]|nr:dihydroorotate dehydrogenase [Thermoguttaceae bacterium]
MHDPVNSQATVDLSVQIGPLRLPNPVMVASGTFGLGWELEGFVPVARLGALIPKTVTRDPRKGNPPPRTVETPAGMLNSIGLDNDGIDAFLRQHLPRLRNLGCPIIVSIAGKSVEEFGELAALIDGQWGVAAIELNVSCPNVAGGIDFATDPGLCGAVVRNVRAQTSLPTLVKLTPNVSDIVSVARAAWEAGADAVTVANTLLGMSVDWRRRVPRLGGVMGGLSGPAIKPVALRAVFQIARALPVPIIAAGGISTIDDCMEFLVTGASAVQLGTVNFYYPSAITDVLDGLPAAIRSLGAVSVREVVGSLSVLRELRWQTEGCPGVG